MKGVFFYDFACLARSISNWNEEMKERGEIIFVTTKQ